MHTHYRRMRTGSMGCLHQRVRTTPLLWHSDHAWRPARHNPACDLITSYTRQPATRFRSTPTEYGSIPVCTEHQGISRFNGDIRYSLENKSGQLLQGLQGFDASYVGSCRRPSDGHVYRQRDGQRRVVAIDYGMTWDATKTLTFSDQVEFLQRPSAGSNLVSTGVTLQTPCDHGQ